VARIQFESPPLRSSSTTVVVATAHGSMLALALLPHTAGVSHRTARLSTREADDEPFHLRHGDPPGADSYDPVSVDEPSTVARVESGCRPASL
jgi:hypothetical protein